MSITGIENYPTERLFDLWHTYALSCPRAVGSKGTRKQIEDELFSRGLTPVYNADQGEWVLAEYFAPTAK